MYRLFKHILILIVAAIGCMQVHALSDGRRKQISDSLKTVLAHKTTPEDSVKVMLDIYDVSRGSTALYWINEVFETARRIGDNEVMLDAARRYSNVNRLDMHTFRKMVRHVGELPKSRERDETLMFMLLRNHSRIASGLRPEERARMISDMLTKKTNDIPGLSSVEDEFYRTFKLIIYLSSEYGNSYLSEYLDQLGQIIDQVELYALKNLYYNQAAIAWSVTDEFGKSNAANERLLEITRELAEDSAKDHPFRNYDVSYFNIYRRMLRNYPALSSEEVENAYRQILEISRRDDLVKHTLKNQPRPQAYYHMARGEYKEAIPFLQKSLQDEHLYMPVKVRLLKLLAEAAEKTANYKLQLATLNQYVDILKLFSNDRAAEKYRELQIKFDVQELEANNNRLAVVKAQAELDQLRIIIWTGVGVALVLAGLFVLIYLSYRKAVKNNRELKNKRKQLMQHDEYLKLTTAEIEKERNRAQYYNIARDKFISSFSRDIKVPISEISELAALLDRQMHYGDLTAVAKSAVLVNNNAEQLELLIDDVLFVSSTPEKHIESYKSPVSVSRILEYCRNTLVKRSVSGVEVTVMDETSEDFNILTDRKLVERILHNIIENACTFTTQGYIEVKAFVDNDRHNIVFSVSDSGIGVPEKFREEIFERFVKLDPSSPGSGLGLYVAQQIAESIGGKITYQAAEPWGSVFSLILPL